MSRKTLILREDQFNEICGTNTAYLDNPGDYAEDGLTTTKTGGAVSDSNGEKEYSDPLTTDDYAHELAPETLFAMLFRNGGHGLWGHWGSGLRGDVLDGFDNKFDLDDDEYEVEFDDEDDSEEDSNKKKLQESNGELENRTWRLDLDNDGLKKTYSYTNLTTKKTDLKRLLVQLVQQNAPKQQIQRVKSALAGVCRVLDRETGTIKQRKTNRKNLGFANQFQKEGGTKNSGNGKAHSKKIKDPNVGTGYITYA